MAKTLSKNDIKILKQLGFKSKVPDKSDPKYIEYRLNIPNHAYLKRLHIIIGDEISVWCREAKGGLSGGDVLLLAKEYKLKKVFKLLKLLTFN